MTGSSQESAGGVRGQGRTEAPGRTACFCRTCSTWVNCNPGSRSPHPPVGDRRQPMTGISWYQYRGALAARVLFLAGVSRRR